ncbi:LytR/AlgR family response regulator transcription factor [Planctobacterium marinum]|uniref:DNA-binding response regulator n=1 Tax=Planctobacterium marinum TaxID=1631968 RepID=A0AA48KR45_9ALTE|nr:DNA-binding response regulator [Planctobacterium marinum]
MSKIRSIIVDDEPLALSILRSKLGKLGNVDIIAECQNGREAVSKITELGPDLVFMDIQMPGLNGFDVIKKLQSDIIPLIIFTTAYEQYAIDAFEVHAVDYVLKPIDQERIELAVNRAQKRLKSDTEEQPRPTIKTNIMSALDEIKEFESGVAAAEDSASDATPQVSNKDKKIVIKERDEITLLKQETIAWVDAAGDYCCLHAEGDTHIKRTTLKNLLDDLDPMRFKRVHRSTIVNLDFIEKVIPHTKGEFFLELGDMDRIKVSRNYRDVIKAFLAE